MNLNARHFVFILGLSSSLFSVSAFSQSDKFSFKLGMEYDLPKKSENLAFFGNDQDGIVNLSIRKEALNIVRFNPGTLAKTFEKTIDIPEATSNMNSEIVTDFSSPNYFWLHSDWDKSNERERLYYSRVDVKAGKLVEQDQKLLETSKLGGDAAMNGFYNYKLVNKYAYEYNVQRNKLLVSYRMAPEFRNDKKNIDKIGLHVFDNNMKKLWGGEFTMPYTEAIMDNSDFSIDGEGNAYLLAKVYDSDSRKELDKSTGKAAYRYEVFKFSSGSKKIAITPVLIDDYFIKEASLKENSNHEMVVACTYGKKNKGSDIEGIFLALLGNDGKLIKFRKGYYPFPKEELEKFERAKERRRLAKDDYQVDNLKVRDIQVESDGSIFIACEEFYIVTNTYYNGTTTRTTTTYYYGDILGTKLSADGKFQWLRKIPKRQKGSSGPNTMSFKLISDSSGYYFLYLDNIKNLHIQDDEVPKYHVDGAGGQVIVSKISNEGTVTKDLLFDTRDEDIMIYPSRFQKINGHQFIGRARIRKNLFQPVIITSK